MGKVEAEQIERLKRRSENTLIDHLDIDVVEAFKDKLVLTMPVQAKTHQPAGILHGGASVVLAETAATFATAINIDMDKKMPVGIEINANHVRSKQEGLVTATSLHKGRTTMVWDSEPPITKVTGFLGSKCFW